MNKIACLFGFLIGFLLIINNTSQSKEKLRWAADAESNAPFIFCNPENPSELIGFELDIAREIAKVLDMEDVFVQNQWDGLIPGLERNDYDIAINGLEITPDRLENINFSKPYYITFEQIVVRSNQKDVKNLEELKGKNVGALKYSLAEKILVEFGGINVRSYEGEVNSFADLETGRLDAVLVDAPIALYYASLNPKFKLSGEPVGEIVYGIAIKQSDTVLLNKINFALTQIINNGRLREILEDWNLWNTQMGNYLNDDKPSRGVHKRYDEFVASQSQESGFMRLVKRYVSFLPMLLEAAVVTLGLSIIAMILAIVFGLFVGLVRVFAPSPISKFAVLYIEIIRGTPLLIQLF